MQTKMQGPSETAPLVVVTSGLRSSIERINPELNQLNATVYIFKCYIALDTEPLC